MTAESQNNQAEVYENEAVSSPNLVGELADRLSADFYLYSGQIDREGANRFIDLVEHHCSSENAALILTTYGGIADSAYRIVRHLKRRYSSFTLYVFGPCKSAGTLLALGADEIVMSCWGEFGPLDVQLVKRDDLAFRNSGLDISEALVSLSSHAFTLFERQFIEIIMRSGGAVSTRTAGEIAGAIATGLLAPITAQIDPLQIGEVQRALQVASDYAERLNADPRTIRRLVRKYSSHSFVIDYEEACQLFSNVRMTDSLESNLEHSLVESSEEGTGHECIREPYPHPTAVIAFLQPLRETENDELQHDTETENEEAPTPLSNG